jgi:hypothetical protein
MKIGDLVELSAHGKSLVMCYHRRGVVGLITEIYLLHHSPNVYGIMWTCATKPEDGWQYSRRDLKHTRRQAHDE